MITYIHYTLAYWCIFWFVLFHLNKTNPIHRLVSNTRTVSILPTQNCESRPMNIFFHLPFFLQLVLHMSLVQQSEQTLTDLLFTSRLPSIWPEAILAHCWNLNIHIIWASMSDFGTYCIYTNPSINAHPGLSWAIVTHIQTYPGIY